MTKLKREQLPSIINRFLQVVLVAVVQAVLFFGAAGRFDLPKAWFYFGLTVVYLGISMPIVLILSPEVVAERGKSHQGVKKWDAIFGIFFAIGIFAMPFVAGLDVGRFGWSNLGPAWLIAGTVCFIIGYALTQWAMIVNKYFETGVRIQEDREQKAVTAGPYRFVRHPGYVGMLLGYGAMPMILGSAYAFIPYAVFAIALIGRTAMEDKTLQKELPGYKEFTQKTRYRLFPGVW